MSPSPSQVTARTRWAVLSCLLALTMGFVMLLASFGLRAFAAESPVDLGTAAPFSVLGGQAVTNTGTTTLSGDLGVSPGTSITGFPPSQPRHSADAVAIKAQSDLTIAYNSAASRAPINNTNYDTLGGRTLVSGVYNATSTMALTGTVTLDGGGRGDGVWIFQVGSALDIAVDSTVSLTNGANACNVFWQVGSSATLHTDTVFVGTIMALTSISVDTNTTVAGRALARNGAVTLDNNVFTGSDCEQVTPSPSESSSPTGTGSPTATESASESPSASESDSESPSASESGSESASPTVTASQSETEQPTEASSDRETESEVATTSTTGSGGNLARTGSSGLTSILAVGGLALLAAGGALLITGRLRRQGRHQG